MSTNQYTLPPPPEGLHQCTRTGSAELIELCIQRGDDPSYALNTPWFENGPSRETPLHIAVRYQLYEVCLLLARSGANLNARNSDGMTPIDLADQEFKRLLLNGLAAEGLGQGIQQTATPNLGKVVAGYVLRGDGTLTLLQHSGQSLGTSGAAENEETVQEYHVPRTDLPEGWIKAKEKRSGKSYYIHVPTKTAQWRRPTPSQQQATLDSEYTGPSLTPSNPNETFEEKLERLIKVEEYLREKQFEIDIQQAQLKQVEQQIEVQKQLELLKSGQPNWQIPFEEIELSSKIGEGGFGEVFLGKWRGTIVAVKTLKGTNNSDPKEVTKFVKEATVLRALQHPCLVLFLGACISPTMCMVSVFMEGGSLFALLYKKKQIPSTSVRLNMTRDISQAMAYLHNCKPPIVHRDLKSLNILLDRKQEHAKVCDVGLARVMDEELSGAVGTYLWMPPEMMTGTHYTTKADVYSFSMVLYEMCTGKIPFHGLTPVQVKEKVVGLGERPPLNLISSQKWRDLLSQCWAGPEEDRPSFVQILQKLDEFK